MKNAVVGHIIKVELTETARQVLSAALYDQTLAWLGQWTPQNNFKAVIANTSEEVVSKLRHKIQTELSCGVVSRALSPSHFQFMARLNDISDGEFWINGYHNTSWIAIPAPPF